MNIKWMPAVAMLATCLGMMACARSAQDADTQVAEPRPVEIASAPAPAAPPISAMEAQSRAGFTADTDAGHAWARVEIADQLKSAASSQADGERRFLRTANARFRVLDTYAAALAIEDLVARQRGFVVRNDINAQVLNTQTRSIGRARLLEVAEYTVNGTLTVRVPGAQLQGFLRELAQQVQFLDARSMEANDVQFELLAKSLAQQREAQAAQELAAAVATRPGRADQLADAVQARRRARERRDQALIEQRQTEDRIAFSTITLALYQPSMLRRTELPDVQAVLEDNAPPFSWRLGQAFKRGWEGLKGLALAAASVWPAWVVLGAAALGIGARLRRRRTDQRT